MFLPDKGIDGFRMDDFNSFQKDPSFPNFQMIF